MTIILAIPKAAPAPRFARLRRLWHSFVREHLLEVEPDWSAWTGTLRLIAPGRPAGAHLKAS